MNKKGAVGIVVVILGLLIIGSSLFFTANEIYKNYSEKTKDNSEEDFLINLPVLGPVNDVKIPENPYSNGGGGGSSSKKSSGNSKKEKHALENYESNYEDFKLLEIDGKTVYYYQRMIEGAFVENDFKSYQFDSKGNFLKKEVHWRDDLEEYYLPENIISSEKAEALVEGEIEFSRLYIISAESEIFLVEPKPENPCWVVSTITNETMKIMIIDSISGEILGEGVPPRYSGFSFSGPAYNFPCSLSWGINYQNAEYWFNEMGYDTEAVEWPTKSHIQSHIQSNTLIMFYEVAHGNWGGFYGGCDETGQNYEATYASDIETWITGYNKIPFNFLYSCDSMCQTGDNTISYELMKGSNEDTVAMGYCGLSEPECWDCYVYATQWQSALFNYMNQGYNVKDAFDEAQADYPFCVAADCVRFTGDEDFKAFTCDEDWGKNYCKDNDVYHNKTCVNLIDVVMLREEEKVSECGEDEYSENYCYDNDIYRNYTARGCGTGSCYYDTVREKINECAYGCNNAECVYPDLVVENVVIQNIQDKTVVLAFTIKNIGNFIAENVYWMIDTDSGDINPERTDAVELGVGEFTRAYMLWEYAVSGTYNPNVIIDFEDLIIEFNESNNEESIEVIVE